MDNRYKIGDIVKFHLKPKRKAPIYTGEIMKSGISNNKVFYTVDCPQVIKDYKLDISCGTEIAVMEGAILEKVEVISTAHEPERCLALV